MAEELKRISVPRTVSSHLQTLVDGHHYADQECRTVADSIDEDTYNVEYS
jgi:hypothetical protein